LTLQLGLIVFWGLWHSVVLLTNICEGLKVVKVLPLGWQFASKNYEAITRVTEKYRPARWFPPLLFLGVLLWQLLIVIAFVWAMMGAIRSGAIDRAGTTAAFTLSLSLLGAFMLADEVCMEYDTEHVHILFFIAQLVTVVAISTLPS